MKSFHVYWKIPTPPPGAPKKQEWADRHPRAASLIGCIFYTGWSGFVCFWAVAVIRQGSFHDGHGHAGEEITPQVHPIYFWFFILIAFAASLFVLSRAIRCFINAASPITRRHPRPPHERR